MQYGSVCSGIEAATAAWHSLGWTPAWFSEIEKFPCKVLKHHYPNVPNLGDMTKFKGWHDDPINGPGAIDLLVGGTPCQSFSVAGLRKGMDDPRGNLALTYLAIADRYRPRWLVWENVPGVLSINEGKDFGSILGGMGELGYGVAYRILDAQHFGVPQRRRRVFVVGYLGDWRLAAAVLFERHSLQGNSPPSREKRKDPAGFTESSFGGFREDFGSGTLKKSGGALGGGSETLRVESIAIHPHVVGRAPTSGPQGKEYLMDGSAYTHDSRGVPQMVATLLTMHEGKDGGGKGPLLQVDKFATLATGNSQILFQPVAFPIDTRDPAVATACAVRRLTPRECERLQGFPDDFTAIPGAKDGPRYKALGNSMAVPVMKWIGERIKMVVELNLKEGK